jgi:hypothetical protein
MKLYELANQFKSLELLESTDDLPPEVIRDTLEGLEGQLQDKATNVALFIRNLESTADAIDAAADKMRSRGSRLRERAQSLNEYLLFNMQATGISKIESPFFTLTVRNNPATVVIDSENLIPAEFMRTPEPAPPPKPTPDKSAIARAIKSGAEVPGAHTEQRQRLEIKL